MNPAPCAREDEVLDAQRGFRAMLTALARPGTVTRLPAPPPVAPGVDARLAQIAQVLLDREVTFATCGAAALARHVIAVTGSRWVGAESADYILGAGAAPLSELAALPVRGSRRKSACGSTACTARTSRRSPAATPSTRSASTCFS